MHANLNRSAYGATWMCSDEAMEGLPLLGHPSAMIATDAAETIYDARHTHDASHGNCCRDCQEDEDLLLRKREQAGDIPEQLKLSLYESLRMSPYDPRLGEMDPRSSPVA